MELGTFIGWGIGIIGIFLTIYFSIRNKKLKQSNYFLRRNLTECNQKCSCNVNIH